MTPFVAAVPSGAVLADVRYPADGSPGRRAHEAGHLPGAVFVDLDAVLAGPPGPQGRHPLPDPARFARDLGALGIGDGDAVVAYDDAGGVFAARLVWLLRATGRDAALLDGGLTAWTGPREAGAVARPARGLTPVDWPADRLVDLDGAAAAAAAGALVDARPGERVRGEVPDVDPRRGHVPGATSLPCREHVGPDGRLLPDDVLRARLLDAGWREGVVSSCGSGVTACHTLLVAERLGLPPGRLWVGSWSQWAATGRPAATGA